MVIKAIIKSCELKSNRGARIVEGDEPRSLLLLYPQGQAAEYKQEVQHVVMPISTFKSVAWPAMIYLGTQGRVEQSQVGRTQARRRLTGCGLRRLIQVDSESHLGV